MPQKMYRLKKHYVVYVHV